ncbi:thermonuclease family protein [Chitinophaga rhizophila]|uniref:Thermonuclease family protein n=1 Tax=Chitinophaga rhizophila TaxID=2866212 RepID=A0ABS7GEC4_9BACT|nr:thermonuclease family protein [Chitinophaga rhizophila]MBW8686021.1 thermonuclease family protein [Chitinophaga rhizophila]
MPKVFYCVVSCLILCLSTQLSIAADPPKKVKGKVVRIMDGDTFELLVNKITYKIRLSAIDAPEKGQDFYQKSKQALSNLCFNKTVTVELLRKDKYQRWIGDVYSADGQYINGRMISDGYAWHYTEYSKSAPLAAAQATAKRQKLGLWSQSKPVAPWLFRAEHRNTKPRKAA